MAATGIMGYKPPRKKYVVKSDAQVLSKVGLASALTDAAASIPQLGQQVESAQGENTNTVDHLITHFVGKHDLGIPQGKRYVNFDAKSAKAPDIIFRLQGMLLAPIRYEYIAAAGKAREEDADEIENFLNALPGWIFRQYETRYDIKNRFWQLLAGKSYVQQSFLPFHWDKNELRRQKDEADNDAGYNQRVKGYRGYMGPPLFRESLDPRMVFPLQTPMGNEGYIKHYRTQTFQMQEAFRKVGRDVVVKPGTSEIVDIREWHGVELPIQSTEQTGTSPCEYWEYLDDTYCYYVIGGKVAHKYNHRGGIKIAPAYGLQTGFNEFALSAVGILWPVRNELAQYDFMRTLWVNKAYLDVFPQLFARLSGDEDPIRDEQGNPTAWNIEPMTVKQIRGELINALKDNNSGVDFRAALENFAADIDFATIPNLARGFAGAQQPGYSINQLSQTMRTHTKQIIESAELQESILAEHALKTNKQQGDEWSVYAQVADENTGRRSGKYLTLDPKKVDDFCRVEAHLDPDLPIDKQGQMLTHFKLYTEGGESFEDYWREGQGKTNPVAARRKIVRDAGIRAMMPEAFKAAMQLGSVKLTNDIIAQRGADKLNSIGLIDIQKLKEARAAAQPPAGDPNAPQPPVTDGQPPVAQPPGVQGAQPAQGGPGIQPTTGANPNNPTPAFRGGGG